MQSKHYSACFGGSAENRTPVRTRKPYVFYMLISAFVFVMQQDLSHQLHPYPLIIHQIVEAQSDYFRFNLRRLISGFGTTSSERRLVLSPCDGIKLLIYYTSIRQREHTHCCQLIFRQKRLWSLPSTSSACLRTISSCRQIQSTPDYEPCKMQVLRVQRYKIIMK